MEDKQKLIIDMMLTNEQTAHETKSANTLGHSITRRAYIVVDAYAREFAAQKINDPWIRMPGLRGIGKTTLLTQLYDNPAFRNATKIYISFERLNLINASMQDFVDACETYLGSSFETYNKPIVLLLDEVQYLEKWGVGLKIIRDRAKRVFIICTGSSAIALSDASDPNVARRVDTIKLHPLCFTEYAMIKQVHQGVKPQEINMPIPQLAEDVKRALFKSRDAEQCYIELAKLTPKINTYWTNLASVGLKSELFGEFIVKGTLPFTLSLLNDSAVWRRINGILRESLDKDMTQFGNFDNDIIKIIPKLLFKLAFSVETSMNNISTELGIHIRTVGSILSALEKTEIINAIPPKGAHNGNVKKASKYLFTSPAMRAALCNYGGIITPENSANLKGKLIEDTVGMYLKRMFFDTSMTTAIVEYDTAQGGADFILSPDGKRPSSIVIEVGANKSTGSQAIQTMSEIGGKYGLIVTSGKLDFDRANKLVRVPFEYFLLA
ncbi:MAG TPA: AAA family ATPase [Candidatus Limnocylindria bacterium]|nr:AAA family ATPase [Candidatus Limnocylindria bacterium]